jgi:hypothetical protein
VPRPVIVDIPHNLGKEEAKRRLQSGLGNVRSNLAGNFMVLKDAWSGDHLEFQAQLLGQTTKGKADVTDTHVRLEVELPMVLAMLAEKAKALVKRQGQLLLEKPGPKR